MNKKEACEKIQKVKMCAYCHVAADYCKYNEERRTGEDRRTSNDRRKN
jgi:hypothetical protein